MDFQSLSDSSGCLPDLPDDVQPSASNSVPPKRSGEGFHSISTQETHIR